MSFPKVKAIILNYNSSSETIGLYNNLKENFRDSLQIIVVDNNSDEKDRERLISKIPKESLLLNDKNLGYAGGNNVGIRRALKEESDFVWILNPDIRTSESTLSTLLEFMKKDKELAVIGPRLIKREDERLIFSDGEKITEDNTCRTYHVNHNKPILDFPGKLDYSLDYVDGSCLLIRNEALESVGLFSEQYFLYFEETDWCYRARKKGWKLAVNSNAIAYNLTSEKAKIFHYYMMRNRIIFSKSFLPNYIEIKRYYQKLLFKEILGRFRGTYLNPFFVSRLKGLFSGIIRTYFN